MKPIHRMLVREYVLAIGLTIVSVALGALLASVMLWLWPWP